MANFVDTLHNIISTRVQKGYRAAGYDVYPMTKSDVKRLESVAHKYGFRPEWLANLINFESAGTFNPAIKNSIGATGLIQFLKSTAEYLQTSTSELAKMSFDEQMDYVDKYLYNYFKGVGANRGLFNKDTGKVTSKFTQADLFMIIFYPAATGNPKFEFPPAVSAANNGIKYPTDYVRYALSATTAPFRSVVDNMQGGLDYIKKNPIKVALIASAMIGIGFGTYYLLKRN